MFPREKTLILCLAVTSGPHGADFKRQRSGNPLIVELELPVEIDWQGAHKEIRQVLRMTTLPLCVCVCVVVLCVCVCVCVCTYIHAYTKKHTFMHTPKKILTSPAPHCCLIASSFGTNWVSGCG